MRCHIDARVLRARVKQELLNLVAADVDQNAAGFRTVEEPIRPGRNRPQPVRPQAQHLNHLANRSAFDHLPSQHRAFRVQAFPIIYSVFAPRAPHGGLGVLQLLQRGERAFTVK